MRCTSCGANIPDTALFCTACGTAVSRPVPEQKPAGLTCVQCGAPIPSGNLFCTACGAKAPAQQAPKQQAAASVPRPGAGGKTCPVCGRVIAPGYAFCTGCGTPVHAARTAAPEPPRPTPMTVCRSCGASVPAGVPYCTACGADMRFGGYEKPKKSRAGLVIGILFAFLQQRFGFIKMPGNFLVNAYPVILQWSDILSTMAGVALIGYLIALLPVRRNIPIDVR